MTSLQNKRKKIYNEIKNLKLQNQSCLILGNENYNFSTVTNQQSQIHVSLKRDQDTIV